MKILRQLLFFLIALVVAAAILSFMLPTHQKINRSLTINAPAQVIYDELKLLRNFNQVSVWGRQDSSLRYTFSGEDGQPGATSSWKGDPEVSGEGKITILSLVPPNNITHTIEFSAPRKGKAESAFSLVEKDKNNTTVTWYFKLATPRPWNIFNLFFSLDKQMGKDFDDGLAFLKRYIETKQLINQPPAK